jgi:hypothetical protein
VTIEGICRQGHGAAADMWIQELRSYAAAEGHRCRPATCMWPVQSSCHEVNLCCADPSAPLRRLTAHAGLRASECVPYQFHVVTSSA